MASTTFLLGIKAWRNEVVCHCFEDSTACRRRRPGVVAPLEILSIVVRSPIICLQIHARGPSQDQGTAPPSPEARSRGGPSHLVSHCHHDGIKARKRPRQQLDRVQPCAYSSMIRHTRHPCFASTTEKEQRMTLVTTACCTRAVADCK